MRIMIVRRSNDYLHCAGNALAFLLAGIFRCRYLAWRFIERVCIANIYIPMSIFEHLFSINSKFNHQFYQFASVSIISSISSHSYLTFTFLRIPGKPYSHQVTCSHVCEPPLSEKPRNFLSLSDSARHPKPRLRLNPSDFPRRSLFPLGVLAPWHCLAVGVAAPRRRPAKPVGLGHETSRLAR
jgi:hypothetical protein